MKKFLSMLLILALAASVFTACGDKPASSGSTTDAPAASSSEPEPQEPPYDPAVLTGLPKSDDYPEGQRITAVMVNNITVAPCLPITGTCPRSAPCAARVTSSSSLSCRCSRFMCISARAWCRRSMLRITLIRIWI